MAAYPPTQPGIVPRLAGRALRQAMDVMPVVVVIGARQTGKSTLVQTLPELAARPYATLDDLDVLETARLAPDDLVRRAPELILDEVQREADVVLAVKRAVDEARPRRPGRFVLTGSANLLLMNRVSETLAGRATYVPVWPLTRQEQLGRGTAGRWSEIIETPPGEWYDLLRDAPGPAADWRELARRGGYPTPALELGTPEQRAIWFAGYVKTFLERDLQDLATVENIIDFRRLMRVACLRLGNVMNKSEMARDAGLTQPTAHRYLNLLEVSFQLISLPPYSVNRTSRLIKSPKAYWGDTGLALHLADEPEPRGAHLENLVLTDLIAWRDSLLVDPPQVLFWRTSAGREVDFVVEHSRGLLAVEVKATTRPRRSDIAGLMAFREEYGDAVLGGLLLHTGPEIAWLAPGILGLPWWHVI
ncbi:MAG: ATP-binding protein [Gemmatimonadetes bacterium]|nr:ATP-binding protein [Gemmatimonadota bacterium]